MATDAIAADSGALTLDQAVTALSAPPEKEKPAPVETEQPEEQNPEAEPTAEDVPEPEAAIEGAETETEEPQAEQPAAIDPPKFWDAEAKKRFGELPRDLQELVLTKETERDKATSAAMQKAAETRKAAEGEASRIAQFNGVLDKLLPQAIETFKSRWEGVDWNKVVDEHGAEQALKLRNDFERERGIVQQLQAAKSEAENTQFAKFVEVETAKLPELAPDLVDPKHGDQRRKDLGEFLVSTGVPNHAIRNMTANETSIAYDAMRWRKAQADAKAKSANPPADRKPAAQPARPSVRPTAAPDQRNPQSARLQQLSRKPSLTIDEAVELRNLKEQQA